MLKEKMAKWFLRYRGFVGTYKTHGEKKKSSDPEIAKYIRAKRKPKNIPDNYTDTKWIKKISDKSWKTRCRKRHQYDKHVITEKEKEFCCPDIEFTKDLIRRKSVFGFNDYYDIKSRCHCIENLDDALLEMESDGEIIIEYKEKLFSDFGDVKSTKYISSFVFV